MLFDCALRGALTSWDRTGLIMLTAITAIIIVLSIGILIAHALDVEPQQVVLGQTEAADWRLRFYPPMRPMPIVSMKPVGEFLGAAV